MSNLYTVTFMLDHQTVITTVSAKNKYDAVCEAIEQLFHNLLIPRGALRRANIEVKHLLEDVTL